MKKGDKYICNDSFQTLENKSKGLGPLKQGKQIKWTLLLFCAWRHLLDHGAERVPSRTHQSELTGQIIELEDAWGARTLGLEN